MQNVFRLRASVLKIKFGHEILVLKTNRFNRAEPFQLHQQGSCDSQGLDRITLESKLKSQPQSSLTSNVNYRRWHISYYFLMKITGSLLGRKRSGKLFPIKYPKTGIERYHRFISFMFIINLQWQKLSEDCRIPILLT